MKNRSITQLAALGVMLLLSAVYLGLGAGPAAADSPPGASRTPDTIDFGSQQAGTTSSPRTITVTSVLDGWKVVCDPTQIPKCWEQGVPTRISSLTIGGPNAAVFSVSGQNCTGRNLVEGQSCSIDVTFSPDAVGRYSATLTLNSNSSWSTGNLVQLSGNAPPLSDCSQNENGTKIAYSASDGPDSEIYTIDDTGGTPCQVTNNSTAERAPSLSSDGKKIAYESVPGFGQDSEIYTIDASGGTPVQVTNNTRDDSLPAYSPDGKKIAYRHFDGTDQEIYTIDASGGTPVPVTNNTTSDWMPSYSPDGTKIAYSTYDGQDWEIYTIDASGGTPFQVTNNATKDFHPTYSPNGTKIAYDNCADSAPQPVGSPSTCEIYTIDASGGTPVPVTNNTTPDGNPSYSPDGQKIAYESSEGTADREIYAIDASGGTPFNVTNNTGDDFFPSYPVPSTATPQPPSCTITGTANAETISGTSADDVICAGGGNDTLKGLGGNDILKAEAGNDTLLGGIGNDTLDGGLGTDTASYSASLTAVTASLATNSAMGEGSDTFLGVENLLGSSKADSLTGSAASNKLTGGGGPDTQRGGLGNDQVIGSGGADILKGEDGDDTVNSKDGVNGNDSLDGGLGTDTKVTDSTEKSVVGFP